MMHVIGLLHPRQTYLIQSGDREGTQQSFILGGGGEGCAEWSNPLLLNIPFSTEIVPLSYNFVCLLTAVNSMNIRYN